MWVTERPLHRLQKNAPFFGREAASTIAMPQRDVIRPFPAQPWVAGSGGFPAAQPPPGEARTRNEAEGFKRAFSHSAQTRQTAYTRTTLWGE